MTGFVFTFVRTFLQKVYHLNRKKTELLHKHFVENIMEFM